ncbi:RN180 ligase, partial [Dasyornis broadbenti]|nr:RN180 ligase [Dasyornis broadbenti]
MNNRKAGVLHCWRCRKYIANSVFLAKCNGKETSELSQPSAAAQKSCNVWHVGLEAIPEWVKCVIEKAQWTIGNLHCPFCEAFLGGFVCNKDCSCGQLVITHFCKTWTEHQSPFSVKLSKSPEKYLLKIQSGFNKDTCHEVVTATLEIKNQRLFYAAGSNNGAGKLTESLSLETKAPRYEIKSKKLPLKELNQKRKLSFSYHMKDVCTVKHFHRRSHGLDVNIRERLVLSPVLYETCSMGTLYHGQNENPPFYAQGGSQLKSSRKDGSSFQDLYSSGADILQNQFQVTSITTIIHRETESECDFEATGQSSGSIIADGSPFMMNLSWPTKSVEEKQYITPVGLVRPMSISFNQRLNKREGNTSKSLRRKQRRREHCLQKQTANDNLHTDDERELRGDKESYLCAVCLDVYFNPYMCYPCHHIFCEPCLRMLAKDNPASTPCPLCRTTIARVFFQTELNNSTRSFFPTEYLKLKENFQKFNSEKWPLPSCKKAFRVFEGFQRRSNTVTRRHFPHAAHRMDYMDFEDDSRGWWFDMDMVIIYIYSVNWIIGFIVFCFLCYFFFPL